MKTSIITEDSFDEGRFGVEDVSETGSFIRDRMGSQGHQVLRLRENT